ncbi:MAG: NnrS family protein [Betaproteobacteria bacterium]|nr:NnrS family protein [Betaproteobacteria bacterium]
MPASQEKASRPWDDREKMKFALWNLGFRPFYLLAGLFAVLALALWTAHFAGWLAGASYLRDPLWHAHEMIFGYAFAVIAGFLLTAVCNWTGLSTPTGSRLAAIAALWVAGRVLPATPWPLAAAAADTAFALALAAGIGVPLVASGNRRNYFFIALMLAIGGANLAFHLAMSGRFEIPVRDMLQLGLNLIAFIMALMGGRVIPMFTANGVPGTKPVRRLWLERVALASLLVLLAADLVHLPPVVVAVIAGISAAAHAWRLALWQPLLTRGTPLVWILHAAYAWLVLYLILRALAGIGIVPSNLATHALTVGAIGGLTLGMMTRTARGHTGRALRAEAAETACYVLINLAAVVRVFVPLAAPAFYRDTVIMSGVLWAAAFAVFVFKYWPILTRPRVDGRSG